MSESIASGFPQPGEVIDDKYRIDRLLGEGGMGAVARATHLLRRAPVALKFMSPHLMLVEGAVERFLNEGVAASQIDSDHVVKVFDVGRLPSGAPFLVMECLEGEDLAALLEREGKAVLLRDIPRCIHFVLQILRGLQVAHAVGIVHRDMKPANCFVIHKDGEPDFLKLLDFGISKVQQPDGMQLTRTNSTMGTPLYMAPEQAKSARKADARADLYSTAAILYELLTGRTPYTSETGEVSELLYQIFTRPPTPAAEARPDLPPPLGAAIDKGLAREPQDRYQTAAEMCEALVPWADGRSSSVIQRIRHRARAGASVAVPSAVPMSAIPAQTPRLVDESLGVDQTVPQGSVALPEAGQTARSPQLSTQAGASVALSRPPKRTQPWTILGVALAAAALGGLGLVLARRPAEVTSTAFVPTALSQATTGQPAEQDVQPAASQAAVPSASPSATASSATVASSAQTPASASTPTRPPSTGTKKSKLDFSILQ